MPVTCEVRVAGPDEPGSAGGYLLAGSKGNQEPADLLVVAVGQGGEVAADETLDSVLGASAADVIATSRLTGKAGQSASAVARHNGTLTRVLFLGVGTRSAAALRRSGGELGRLMRPGEAAIADVLAGLAPAQVQAFAEGVLLGSYRFSEKSADVGVMPGQSVVRLVVPPELADPAAAVDQAVTIAAAVALTRDLANTPSLRKTPAWLAQAAADVAASTGLTIRVRAEQELAAEGFGGITAVGIRVSTAAQAHRAFLRATRRRQARGPRGQGHHLRQRRAFAQAQ